MNVTLESGHLPGGQDIGQRPICSRDHSLTLPSLLPTPEHLFSAWGESVSFYVSLTMIILRNSLVGVKAEPAGLAEYVYFLTCHMPPLKQ